MCGVTRILFLHTVFSFSTPPYDVQSWGVPEHMFKIEGSRRPKNRRKIKKSSIFEVRDQTFSKNVGKKIDDFRKRRWRKVDIWVKSSLHRLQIIQQLLLLK